MTEEHETPPADPARMRAIARRLILPPVLLAAVIVAAALWFVLYGMKGGDGKETQLAATGECAASAALAPKLTPLAQGGCCRSRHQCLAAAHAGADFFGQRRAGRAFVLQGKDRAVESLGDLVRALP